MTADEFAVFIAEVRVQLDAQEALLDATDRASLPPELREAYDEARADVEQLRAMIEDDAIALQMEATLLAGRDLTLDEAKALVRRQ